MWYDALNEFIKPYIDDPNILAILLVGSYAAGNQNDYSDIDVYLVLDDQAGYRVRGNKLVNGFMIEYFINPVYMIKKYMADDKRGFGGAMANMLLNGKVLFERKDVIKDLKEEALKYQHQEYEVNVFKYYFCWDAYDEYKAAKYHNEMQYYIVLERLVEAYLLNHGYPMVPLLKMEKIFKDKEYRKNYHLIRFPRGKFNQLVIQCFDKPCCENLDNLYHFVMDNNFDINHFEWKENIEKG